MRPGSRGRAEAAQVDAVGDHDDLRRVVPFAHQPVLHRFGVDDDAIGETAHVTLDEPLHRGQVQAQITNRRDDRRRAGHPRRRQREHVSVEAVRVHDLDAPPCQMARELRLLCHRGQAVERPDPVLRQRNLPVLELLDEGAEPPETGEFEIETARIERSTERHHLALGPATEQRRHDFHQPDRVRRRPRRRPDARPQASADSSASDLCDAHDACALAAGHRRALRDIGTLERDGEAADRKRSRTGRRSDERRPRPRKRPGRPARPRRGASDRAAPAAVPRTARPPSRSAGRPDRATRTAPAPAARDRPRTGETRCEPTSNPGRGTRSWRECPGRCPRR